MARYPFYEQGAAVDFEDLSYYGGRFNFYYPRTGKNPNRLKLWNKYAYADHLYGPGDPDDPSGQATTATGGMSAEEAASLSDGKGYPKLQPSPVWPLEAEGKIDLLPYTYTAHDVGALNQYPNLPDQVINVGDGELNAGLRAMLQLFGDSLTLASSQTRTYWWPFRHEFNAFTNTLDQYWGQVEAWPYKWTNPGKIESPIVEYEAGVEDASTPGDFQKFAMTTPFYYSGDMLNPMIASDPANMEILPLTHTGPDAETVTNRFARWSKTIFWLVSHPSDVPDGPGSAEQDLRAHDLWIRAAGKVHLYDIEVRESRPVEDGERKWIKTYG